MYCFVFVILSFAMVLYKVFFCFYSYMDRRGLEGVKVCVYKDVYQLLVHLEDLGFNLC